MLKIRLRRMGSRQDAFYRVVVSEKRRTPRGSFIETLGTYDPGTKPETIKLDVAKAESWIQKGAHPSETVRSLIAKAKTVRA